MTPAHYIGIFFATIVIVIFTWQGLNLVMNPKEWLERLGRSTADRHIRASRLIGWMLLTFVLLMLLQLIRGWLSLIALGMEYNRPRKYIAHAMLRLHRFRRLRL